jgi:GT2 family glycosyltransferase
VVVVFGKAAGDVPCLAQLRQWQSERHEGSGFRLSHILIYDNSAVSSADFEPLVSKDVTHVRDRANGGTRAAYHSALRQARALKCDWLLLLDHDTALPADYLSASYAALEINASPQEIGAVVPSVTVNGRLASPSIIKHYGRVIPDRAARASASGSVTAIASAAFIRTEHLADVAPIPADFGLDYLDQWLFRSLTAQGRKIAVSGAEVNHSLSVWAMESMPVCRYESILTAEYRFLRGGPGFAAPAYFAWHLFRTLKMASRLRTWRLMRTCLRHFGTIVAHR